MANFTPIATGAAANAAVVNAPLYELDSAITYLQTLGAITANRPWAIIGVSPAQPTSSDNVPVTADITHTGRMVRGQTSITSSGADFESRGNQAFGDGNHTFTGTSAVAIGGACVANNYSLAVGRFVQASGDTSFAFGNGSEAMAAYSIAMGASCSVDASSTASAVLSGNNNDISSAAPYSVIAGGASNKLIATTEGFIGGGISNQIIGSSHHSGVLAGSSNLVSGGSNNSAIGGGTANSMSATNAMIGAGDSNQVTGLQSFVGSGYANQVAGTRSAILTGYQNFIKQGDAAIQPFESVIAGGYGNHIYDSIRGFIAGGESNTISQNSQWASIVGGYLNTVTLASHAANIVAGDHNTIASAHSCFIGCGTGNTISGVAEGSSAIVAGDTATVTGPYSTVVNGKGNTITSKYSVAIGEYCSITHDVAFMSNSYSGSAFSSAAIGEFAVTAHGGVRIFTNTARSTGMTLAAGTSSWTAVSSAALKGDFHSVEQKAILFRLLSVPIQTYRFKDGDGFHDTVNLGPTAEDWDAAFADILGKKTVPVDDEQIPAISDGDKLGVALAAIQGLTKLVYELQAKLN